MPICDNLAIRLLCQTLSNGAQMSKNGPWPLENNYHNIKAKMKRKSNLLDVFIWTPFINLGLNDKKSISVTERRKVAGQ